MNKRIDFTYNGGFPVTQEIFDWMQDSYRSAFAALAGLIGNKAIIAGVAITGENVGNGWIAYNGELLPFVGGQLVAGATVNIVELATAKTFEDNASREVLFERVAKLGIGGVFPFTDLQRPGAVKDIWLPGDVKMVHCSMEYLATNFDQSGLGLNERTGWQICNGQNGTINMGGRVPVGYDPADAELNTLLNLFGAKEILFDWKNLPVQPGGSVSPGEAGLIKRSINGQNTTAEQLDKNGSGNEPDLLATPQRINLGGESKPLNIMQPGAVTLYIQKL